MIGLTGVSVRAGDGRLLLHEVDLVVRAGERHALVGPSGAGKTTLVLAAIGALPPGLTATGRRTLDGTDLAGLGDSARRRLRRRAVAVLDQDPGAALTPTRSVAASVRELAERPGDVDVEAALGEVGLPAALAHRRRLTSHLSGGQQRRVALARALAASPRLLVVDEPTAGLDPTTRATVVDLLDEVAARRGTTLLVVSHDEAAVRRLGCRVHRLEHGRLSTAPVLRVQRTPPVSVSRPLVAPAAAERVRLRARGLVVARPGRAPVLDGVDLDVPGGALCAVVGSSGAGKSSLARAIVGLDPVRAGSLELDGARLAPGVRNRPPSVRRALQLVHQDGVGALPPHLEVGTAIARAIVRGGPRTGPRRRIGSAAVKQEVAGLLARLGLPADCASRRPDQLSGGQRQRVGLARALACDPHVLLCDETTANLDPDSRELVLALLRRLVASGVAVVLLTHEPDVVSACSLVWSVEAGQLVRTR
ncbi:peptide/nickel transport system ATP-binding protein [Nocardioides zeae]|uniref:Peptide/nickel transport system ATP-binding protein n=1 Tax=Nocardioides zeae TaxID=1457234 RepID=A0ACC6IEW8_9ACTN|nr:ATP-binding cassette domain-containing protein [Nocardioides zeae]MDR6174879.1 peptide/nickel transport system ATP-binding protein [Nocardioides zeae]MDR6209311.1 peptide/nickel transport system ATP-binding protein [Nocardioides zeae]